MNDYRDAFLDDTIKLGAEIKTHDTPVTNVQSLESLQPGLQTVVEFHNEQPIPLCVIEAALAKL